MMGVVAKNKSVSEREDYISNTVADIKPGLPLKMDESLTFTEIRGTADTIIYTYTITDKTHVAEFLASKEYTNSFKNVMIENLLKQPGTRDMLKNGISIERVYMSPEESWLFSIKLTPDDL
jgi:multidrug efflux pump subunit AcrB